MRQVWHQEGSGLVQKMREVVLLKVHSRPRLEEQDGDLVPSVPGGREREEQGQMGKCLLCSQEVWGGGSTWHVLSTCRHETLKAHRARLTEPFKEVVAEVIGEMEGGDWGQGSAMETAFALDQGPGGEGSVDHEPVGCGPVGDEEGRRFSQDWGAGRDVRI